MWTEIDLSEDGWSHPWANFLLDCIRRQWFIGCAVGAWMRVLGPVKANGGAWQNKDTAFPSLSRPCHDVNSCGEERNRDVTAVGSETKEQGVKKKTWETWESEVNWVTGSGGRSHLDPCHCLRVPNRRPSLTNQVGPITDQVVGVIRGLYIQLYIWPGPNQANLHWE